MLRLDCHFSEIDGKVVSHARYDVIQMTTTSYDIYTRQTNEITAACTFSKMHSEHLK